MCRLNPDGLPVSPDMVNTLETQVLSIQNPDNKIRSLVGNIIILIQYKIYIIVFSFFISSGSYFREAFQGVYCCSH